jgi:hypothetical protein
MLHPLRRIVSTKGSDVVRCSSPYPSPKEEASLADRSGSALEVLATEVQAAAIGAVDVDAVVGSVGVIVGLVAVGVAAVLVVESVAADVGVVSVGSVIVGVSAVELVVVASVGFVVVVAVVELVDVELAVGSVELAVGSVELAVESVDVGSAVVQLVAELGSRFRLKPSLISIHHNLIKEVRRELLPLRGNEEVSSWVYFSIGGSEEALTPRPLVVRIDQEISLLRISIEEQRPFSGRDSVDGTSWEKRRKLLLCRRSFTTDTRKKNRLSSDTSNGAVQGCSAKHRSPWM